MRVKRSLTEFSRVPQSLKLIPQWCAWDYVDQGEGRKPRKRPRQYEERDLLPFSDALKHTDSDGVGFRFTSDDPYVGIDIDKLTDFSRKVLDWARKKGAYVERSVNGGWHIIVKGDSPRLGSNKSGIEMYSAGQFFVMTGVEGEGSPDVHGAGVIERINKEVRPEVMRHEKGPEVEWDAELHLRALDYISADQGYDQWMQVGMALHHMGADFEVWHSWSRQKGPRSYVSERDCEMHWNSFGKEGITGRTLEWLAREGGWVDAKASDFPMEPTPPVTALSPLKLVPFDTLADEAKDPDWVVEGIVEKGQMAVLVAHRGRGKTFLAMDMCAHVAAGRDWFNRSTSGERVLYVTSEGAEGFKRRASVYRQNQFNPGNKLMVYQGALALGASRFNEARVTDDMRKLAAAARQGKFGLVVIDTISRNVGWLEENSNGEVAEFLAILQRMLSYRGVTVLLVGHTPKSETLTVRGASAWEGNTDVLLTIEPHEERPTLVLDVPRIRDSAATQVEFRLVPRRDLDERVSLMVEPVTHEERQQMGVEKQEKAKAELVEVMKGGTEPQSAYQWCRRLHGTHRQALLTAVEQLLELMVERNEVVKHWPDRDDRKPRYELLNDDVLD